MSYSNSRRALSAAVVPALALAGVLAVATPASAEAVPSATIGDADCQLEVGSFGLVLQGFEVSASNSGDEPFQYLVEVENSFDSSGTLDPNESFTFAYELDEDQSTLVQVFATLDGSTELLAERTLTLNCEPGNGKQQGKGPGSGNGKGPKNPGSGNNPGR